jgi:CRISPR-associated protein Csd1
MILESLYQLYERLSRDPAYEIAPPGYSLQKITFKVVITRRGELYDLQDARLTRDARPQPRKLIVPGFGKPTGAVTDESVHKKVLLLRNDLPFLVGVAVKEVPGRETKRTLVLARKEFNAFKKFHLDIEHEIDDEAFAAVCQFLRTWDPALALQREEWAEFAGGQGVFQLVGETGWVHDRPAVKQWWENRQRKSAEGVVGQCLITGHYTNLARLHPMIKGVGDSQRSLVGFNFDAVESYGKSQSFNAPVSEEAAFRYATALNALLDGPQRTKHRILIGDTTAAFWTERPTATEDVFAPFVKYGSTPPPDAEEVQDLGVRKRLELFLRALRQGREAYAELETEPERTRFFILGLSPNAGRLAVRFFHSGTLGDLLERLRSHYLAIALDARPATQKHAADPELPPVQLLLDQTCPRRSGKPERDKIPPILSGALLRAIVTGAAYPEALFSAVVRRIQSDGEVTYPRACVIKGYLTRNLGREVSMALDTQREDTAYRLGRLFAALEKTQTDALGTQLNATLGDRFYAAASATPRAAFPQLLRTYRHHLAKLEGGLKVHRDKLVQEILSPVSAFPAHLGLADQGLFAIGYYHQREAFYTAKHVQQDEQ